MIQRMKGGKKNNVVPTVVIYPSPGWGRGGGGAFNFLSLLALVAENCVTLQK